MDDTHQRIREIAYFLWKEEGCPDGQADRHWRSAEALVESEDTERNFGEGELLGDAPGEYVTPLVTLKRTASSAGSG